MVTKGKYTEHHLTSFFGLLSNYNVLFLFTDFQYLNWSFPNTITHTMVECQSHNALLFLAGCLSSKTQLNFTEDTHCNVC